MARRYEVVKRERCYDGFFALERVHFRHARFAGGMTPVVQRECLIRGLAVSVLPYDPVRDEVVLVEQFRVGAIDDPHGAWVMETLAGIAEPGEAPQEVARREAREESGLEISLAEEECELIADYLPSPGGSSERIRLYCARCDTSAAGGIHGLNEENEDIYNHVLSAEVAIEMALGGQLHTAMPIIALQWLALNRQRLRAQWTGGDWAENLWDEPD
ncbi:ADP-ribose diphosphatase [Halorhodospira abdelmalekii]|uniref:NUDIX domain-containing protein n=1 Tax=Halorhodospira abdelmalekii TaxID=421629 RepID=UPI001904C850|nr:NUDIX domain-containing protein [Halorhodospira abdelmalekii]MBK1734789.1 ADP-ribose diphosphatase [Halorhodospira abdelmalekii]